MSFYSLKAITKLDSIHKRNLFMSRICSSWSSYFLVPISLVKVLIQAPWSVFNLKFDPDWFIDFLMYFVWFIGYFTRFELRDLKVRRTKFFGMNEILEYAVWRKNSKAVWFHLVQGFCKHSLISFNAWKSFSEET